MPMMASFGIGLLACFGCSEVRFVVIARHPGDKTCTPSRDVRRRGRVSGAGPLERTAGAESGAGAEPPGQQGVLSPAPNSGVDGTLGLLFCSKVV
jgi:hypothetical protein